MMWLIGLTLILAATMIFIHHYFKHGYWLDIQDVDNHETIALFCLGFGSGWITYQSLTIFC